MVGRCMLGLRTAEFCTLPVAAVRPPRDFFVCHDSRHRIRATALVALIFPLRQPGDPRLDLGFDPGGFAAKLAAAWEFPSSHPCPKSRESYADASQNFSF